MANLSFRERIRGLLPPWLVDRTTLGKTVGFRLAYGVTATLDAAVEAALQGLQARYPGLGTPTALPYLSRDRRIVQGPQESDDAFGVRLVQWLTYWRTAGNAYSLMKAFQAYLSPGYPQLRLVTRSGLWYTLATDGTLTYLQSSPNNWDWDSISNPGNAGNWSDFWVLVYPPHYPDDGLWGQPTSYWGDGKVMGQTTVPSNVAAISALIHQWKGSHSNCVCVIYTYDATAFDPTSAPGDPGMPDGHWGRWSKDSMSGRVKSRRDDCRYWEV